MSAGYDELLDNIGGDLAKAAFIKQEINKWKEYETSEWRYSKWLTGDRRLVPVPDLETAHIKRILTYKFHVPLPDEWRKLLNTELRFRKINLAEAEKSYETYNISEDLKTMGSI